MKRVQILGCYVLTTILGLCIAGTQGAVTAFILTTMVVVSR